MKVKVNKNRQVFKGSLSVGISNENNYEVLEFTFPAELDNYIKYIEIQAENEEGKLEYVDRIQDNKFTLTNRLTKYRELNMEISCRDLNRTVFKSEIFTVTTGEALNILEDLVEQQEDLFERVERELQEVYQGMEEFKTEIVEDANSRFNTNVTEKTQTFNTNAQTKTTDFNNNYDTKLNAFNSNYDEKLGTFNTNATSKLEEYNNNDTAKTEAYNTNATEKLSTYNQNATNKVAEYNSNAESKLNAYNTNATQKLAEYDSRVAELHEDLDETQAKVEQYNTNIDTKYTQYNQNAEQKLSAYNSNATTKTSEYNTNAQTKLEAYNTNATNKTTTYNTNATEKLTAYNTNATEKLEEYNENASTLMQSVETLEQKHNTEVAELNEKIADLQEEVDMASDLIPTGEASGDNITLDDSAWYRFKKFIVGGKSEQEIYTGKNLLNVIYDIDGVQSGIRFTTVKENGLLKYITINGTSTAYIYRNLTDYNFGSSAINSSNPSTGSQYSAYIGTNEVKLMYAPNNHYTYIEIAPNKTFDNVKLYPMILLSSETDTSYEPYTGGRPAPNPNYECPIKNVTGDVEVKVENKNLCNAITDNLINIDDPTYRNFTVNNETKSVTITGLSLLGIKVKVNPNTQYSVQYFIENWKSGQTQIFRIREYSTEPTSMSGYIKQVYNSSIANSNPKYTFTTTSETQWICVIFYGESVAKGFVIENWQVEEGSIATDYIEHEEQIAIFPLEEGQVLREEDTIEDKIVQRRKTATVSGNSATFNDAKTNGQYLCSKKMGGTLNGKTLTFDTSVENAVVEYELETPIETEFTEAQRTAKAQIDKLYSYKGTTHITSNANLDVTYRKDPNLAEEQQNNKLEELEARIALLEG